VSRRSSIGVEEADPMERPSSMALRHALILGCLGVTLLGTACKKKPPGAHGDAGAVVDAGRGLAQIHNDHETVILAKAAAACPRDLPNAHFRAMLDPDCPALKSWEKSEHIARSGDDATLLNMIEDDAPVTRWLGATALIRVHERWGKDKESAARLLTATEAERDKFVGYKLGVATAMIDLKTTGLADRVVALIQDTKRDPWLRGGVIATLSWNDANAFPAIREAMERVARKDDDAFLRQSVVRELSSHEASRDCTLALQLLHDPEDEVVSAAVHGCVTKGCEANIPELLDEIQRRAKAGQAGNETFAWALGQVGKANPPSLATPAGRARLVSLAEEIVKNDKNAGLGRSRAIDVLMELDPRAAAPFVAKYTKDPDALVAAAAKKAAQTAK
jgi:hypothetical protein